MSFTIRATSNPHTSGKGSCITVAVDEHPSRPRDEPAHVMFDTYDSKPGITAALLGMVHVVDADDTDEGCYLRLANPTAELTIVLPLSLNALMNAISTTMEIRAGELTVDDLAPGQYPRLRALHVPHED